MSEFCYPWDVKLPTTTDFGVVIPKWGKHAGMDFSIKKLIGKPLPKQVIRSAWDGVVLVAKKAGDGSGWYVCVYSEKEKVTEVVWHINKKMVVRAGQRVKKGQVIGYAETSNYSPAHNHLQFNKGKVTKGSWNAAVIDPQHYLNRMEIYVKPAPKPPVVVPEAEANVVIPESIYKALIRENSETKQALTASNSLVTSKNLEIEKEQAKTQTEQDLKHLYAEGLKNLSELLGSAYDINTEWDLQRYRYDEVLQKMRKLAAKEALTGLIRRYVEKMRELLNKFKRK